MEAKVGVRSGIARLKELFPGLDEEDISDILECPGGIAAYLHQIEARKMVLIRQVEDSDDE